MGKGCVPRTGCLQLLPDHARGVACEENRLGQECINFHNPAPTEVPGFPRPLNLAIDRLALYLR